MINLNNPSKGGGASGSTDHAALSNLDYASAGHTGFEPSIATGTTLQFWRGDKTFANVDTATFAISSSTATYAISSSTATYAISASTATYAVSVTSSNIVGTANQVLITGGSGAILAATTFSLPQSIDTAASVRFGTGNISALFATIATVGSFISIGSATASPFVSAGTGKFATICAGASLITSISGSGLFTTTDTGKFNTLLSGVSIMTSISATIVSSGPNMSMRRSNPAFTAVWYMTAGGTTSDNNTAEAMTTRGTAFSFPATTTSGRQSFVGRETAFYNMLCDRSAGNLGTLRFYYWNGSAWAVSAVTDGTSNFTQSGVISWADPGNWTPATATQLGVSGGYDETSRYWVRLASSTSSSSSCSAYLVVPESSTDNQIAFYGNKGDTTISLGVDAYGYAILDDVKAGSGNLAIYSDLLINDDTNINLGISSDAALTWETAGNDNLQLGLVCGSAAQSGYFSIMEKADMGAANRSPLTTSVDPVLRVYSSDSSTANDYIEFYHNQTNSVIASGDSAIKINSQYFAPNYASSTSVDWNYSNVQYINLTTGSHTLVFSNPQNGGRYLLMLNQPASVSSAVVSFPSTVLFPTGVSSALSTTTGKVDVVKFVYSGITTKYYGEIGIGY